MLPDRSGVWKAMLVMETRCCIGWLLKASEKIQGGSKSTGYEMPHCGMWPIAWFFPMRRHYGLSVRVGELTWR